MHKVFEGKVISVKMNKTAVVEIVRRAPHKLYKKLLRKSKNFKADTAGFDVKVGDRVKICEIKPISKDKNFKIMEVAK
jgi:small subunit ribosomal protein S17